MKKLYLLFFSAIWYPVQAQTPVSIHQEQSQYYGSLGLGDAEMEAANHAHAPAVSGRSGCNLNKTVYGWHPYWSNGLETNYDWSLLSHFCYFSYELDASTGNALTTHSFSTASSVTAALANGVRVDLCVTLFANHATFLLNATSRQNLINNLISLISARGAHGVNIDFEGIPAAQKTNFTSFMNDLGAQMHAAIPGSQVSSVLYAVDWNNVFDVAAMTNVDFFVIMGYDYYYSGSTTAGPNDPLFQFGSTYNYTLSRSVTYYLDQGLPASKLVLGLPYYGREWGVTAAGIPASTTGTGTSRTFSYVKDNVSGNYSAANRHIENASRSVYYEFSSGGLKQCFMTEADEMRARLDFINKRGLAGMGIWALGYDDGYADFWDAINDFMTDCAATPCTGSITDIGGGAYKNYYDNEDYTFTLAPPGASSVTVNFSAFNLETGYDYLYVYNGPGTAAPQFAGSPFTGSTLPPALTSSGGSITFRFVSDGATTAPGYAATYTCTADVLPPVSAMSTTGSWQTSDFTATFTDTDNTGGTGVNEKFYQVLDFNGTEWRANPAHGFFNDNFTTVIHPGWTAQTGTWNISAAHLQQADDAEANSNIYAALEQNNSEVYLYQWQMNMTGTGTNRRAGLHFFCDDATLPNRGNSYFVYFRADNDRCQIYRVTADVYTLMTDDAITVDAGTWYDCKVVYNPQTGLIRVYLDGVPASEWTDPSPLASGNSLSLRTGGTSALYDDVKVYRARTGTVAVSLGSTTGEVRYQNTGPAQPACRVVTVLNDFAGNWTNGIGTDVNIDWTAPAAVATVMDSTGIDIDAQTDNTQLAGSYTASADPHSGIAAYYYSIGTAPGDSSVAGWTSNGTGLGFLRTGLALVYGETYYINVKSLNGAGLWSAVSSSDGITITEPVGPPVCVYTLPVSDVCAGDSVQLNNTSTGATAYTWSGAGVHFSNPAAAEPYVSVTASGAYAIQLVAMGPGGSDTLVQVLGLTVHALPVAAFTVNNDTLLLPAAFLACTNASTGASACSWSFGDGHTSTNADPWNTYAAAGTYTVQLVAGNGVCPQDTASMTIVVMDATGINEWAGGQLSVYPNPVSDCITVQSDRQLSSYEINDASGRTVMRGRAQGRDLRIAVHALSRGVYRLVLTGDTGWRKTVPVVKQ